MNTKFLRSLLSVALWGTISAATFLRRLASMERTHRDGVIEGSWLDHRDSEGWSPETRSAPVAGGYSGPAVAKARVYVSDFVRKEGTSTNNPGARDQLSGEERIHCFDEKTGKELWSFSEDRKYALSYAAGSASVTPTIDDGLVYFQGAEGHLICLNASDGKLVRNVISRPITKPKLQSGATLQHR
ncbi:MAG: PQQ-binding-like beta-propeller repeat protein [Pirellulales bacterium]